MKDEDKTKNQLITELQALRQRLVDMARATDAAPPDETRLQKSLAELSAIINALPGLVSVVDTQFNVLIANEKVCAQFGNGALQEIIGKKCYLTRKGLAQPCPQCGLVAAFETGKTVVRLSTPAEEKQMGIATKAYAVPLTDNQGAIWGGVEVIMDISDVRRAEESLRKSRERMQLALLGADLGLWDWDIVSGKLTCNPRWAEMLGYALAEIEPNFSSLQNLIHPDDMPAVIRALDAHLDGKRPIYEAEQRLLGKNGAWKWILARGKVTERDKDGNPTRMTGTHLDITERKVAEQQLRQSEEKYRALINGMRDTVWVIDFKGRFIDVNSAAVEKLGYSREELISMGPADIDKNLDAREIENLIGQMPHDRIQVFETVHTAKDGRSIPVEIQSSVVKYHGKDAILSIGRDITERKQAEEERLKLRKLESVGVLAGGIAHDFNNFLTGLFGNIEMAKIFLPADHKASRFLEAAGQSMVMATNLTKQLLTFARGGEPIIETVSIQEALTETAQFSLRGSNAKLQTDIAPDLWPVAADKGQLAQVISNLVINALQAMPGGGIIRLAARNRDLPGNRCVEISLQDQGIGIAPQHLDRVFDPYFTTKQKGSGLGLAITHSIIHKHRGTIMVESEPNRGATFTIRLPAAEGPKIAPAEKRGCEVAGESLAGARILVLDDEETVRNVLGAMLEKMGHRVSFAQDGQEAVDDYQRSHAAGSTYDVVIMDLTIPGGMGGQEAAQAILKIDPRARLIVSSGYATDPVMANFGEYGFQGVVVKPYRFADLQGVMDKVLKTRCSPTAGD